MKDLTPEQEALTLFYWFNRETALWNYDSKKAAKFTAQQIADNTTGKTRKKYLEVIKEIKKL